MQVNAKLTAWLYAVANRALKLKASKNSCLYGEGMPIFVSLPAMLRQVKYVRLSVVIAAGRFQQLVAADQAKSLVASM